MADPFRERGTIAGAFEVDSDAITPKIEIAGDLHGSGNFKATIKPPQTLSGNRVFRLPGDANDTLVGLTSVQTVSGKKAKVTVDSNGATLVAASSGGKYTNTGASGASTVVLPPAVSGLEFSFHVGVAQELRIDPDGTETIGLPSTGVQGAAGKYLVADAVGEWVKLVCVTTGKWTVEGYFGTWTAEA